MPPADSSAPSTGTDDASGAGMSASTFGIVSVIVVCELLEPLPVSLVSENPRLVELVTVATPGGSVSVSALCQLSLLV